jgi:lysophospholipase L1-like esterase
MTIQTWRITMTVALLATVMASAGPALPVQAQADRWASDMQAFDAQDRATPPATGGVVFVGSSSIRLWDLTRHFPGLPTVNRGFGGSQIEDAVRHADLLVIRHRPRVVVFYAGDNDLSSGKTPRQVADDFATFVRTIHAALPETRIAFVGVKPSLARWGMIAKVREANALVRSSCEADPRLAFIDVDGPMIGWDGRPREDLFVSDGLHLSEQGYELWTVLTRPFVEM